MAAGVAGSDPFYEYRLLVDKLLACQPDLVMTVVNVSDVIDVIVRGGKDGRNVLAHGLPLYPAGLPVCRGGSAGRIV
jgi:hypothetical protein